MRKYSLLALALVGTCLATYHSTPVAATPEAAPAPTAQVATPAPAGAEALPAVAAAVEAVPAAPAVAAIDAPMAVEAVPAVLAALAGDAGGLSPEVLSQALSAVSAARARGVSARSDLLTVIDYSLPSTEPRLWVLDLERGKVLFHELVAHGKGTGENYARHFSNLPNSLQTSLGLYLTGGTYEGGNGYSLKLHGLDEGLNDRAEARAIVMHGAWYVSPQQARSQGRLGRSWGCPALSTAMAPRVIDTIKGGSFLYSYYPDETLLARSGGGSTPQTVRAAR